MVLKDSCTMFNVKDNYLMLNYQTFSVVFLDREEFNSTLLLALT